jgi:hypothetical protein
MSPALLVVVALASIGGRADFSGAWALDPKASEAPREERLANVLDPAVDVPLEVTSSAGRIVVADDGATLRVDYPSGRKRVFFLDGEERELDDGDGPAKVTAKRSGASGERITVSSWWSSAKALTEMWELFASQHRLAVTAKVKGRRSFGYKRVYGPAPPEPPTPTPSPTPTPLPEIVGPAAPPPAAIRRTDCSIRPPRGASAEELAGLAKISLADAEKRAAASVAPEKVTSVISSDVEVDDGCLVFPLDLRLAGKKGVQEVLIDAGDGKVLSSKFEAQ